jgi:hypothetical protein
MIHREPKEIYIERVQRIRHATFIWQCVEESRSKP